MKSSTELIIEYLDRNPDMSKTVTIAILVFTGYGVFLLGEGIGTFIGHVLNFVGA